MRSTLAIACTALIACELLASSAVGQDFGDQQVITTLADGAYSVYATDLDGDGDADVLSASITDDKIAWYENLGGGSFGPQHRDRVGPAPSPKLAVVSSGKIGIVPAAPVSMNPPPCGAAPTSTVSPDRATSPPNWSPHAKSVATRYAV